MSQAKASNTKAVSFELSDAELQAIASQTSNVEVNVAPTPNNNGYVIQNAPVPKSLV